MFPSASRFASGAVAEVDLTGQWSPSRIYPAEVCGEVVQEGTGLSVTLPALSAGDTPFELGGTIDAATGEIELTSPLFNCRCADPCGCRVSAHAAADGERITGQMNCRSRVTIVVNGNPLETCLDLPLSFQAERGDCAPASCPGDCNGDSAVSTSELVTGVNILLAKRLLSACATLDADADGSAELNELVAAVNAALNGCR